MGVMTKPPKRDRTQNADLFDYDDLLEKTEQTVVNTNVSQSIDFDI